MDETPVTPTPETPPAPAPEAAPETDMEQQDIKPGKDGAIRIQAQAYIEWRKEPEGELLETVRHYRSMHALSRFLLQVAKEHPEKENDYLEVYLQVESDDPGKPGPKLFIAKGVLKEVLPKIISKAMPAVHAVIEVQMLLGRISEISSLKGAILTLVFDDASAGGLGFLSESSEVTPEDIKVLGEAAANQADMFKEKMRQTRGIIFPGDKGNIILPSGGPANLKIR